MGHLDTMEQMNKEREHHKNKCRVCPFFKLVEDEGRTSQNLFAEIQRAGHFMGACTFPDGKWYPMFDFQECPCLEERNNKLEKEVNKMDRK